MSTTAEISTLSRVGNNIKRSWYNFSKNPLSVVGAGIIVAVVFIAVFAPFVSPYPEHAGNYVNFDEASRPPSGAHLFGTDVFGRDILFHGHHVHELGLCLEELAPELIVELFVEVHFPVL